MAQKPEALIYKIKKSGRKFKLQITQRNENKSVLNLTSLLFESENVSNSSILDRDFFSEKAFKLCVLSVHSVKSTRKLFFLYLHSFCSQVTSHFFVSVIRLFTRFITMLILRY
jgi:hypothetical protein